MPHDLRAEVSLLAVCIRNPNECAETRDTLAADDFYTDAHQRIFRAVCALRDSRTFIDVVSLTNTLKRSGELDDVGGVPYIAELIERGEVANASYYARIVRDASVARGLLRTCNESLRDGYDRVEPVAELLERTQQRLAELSSKLLGDAVSSSAGECLDTVLDHIDRRSRGESPAITPTRFTELDTLLAGGMRHGHLLILAARPSVGKTSLALNIARRGCEHGEPVLFVSLEQSKEELIGRALASVSGVAGTTIMRGHPEHDQIRDISNSAGKMRAWRLEIADRPGMTAGQVAALARLIKRRHNGLGLVVVDYLNEMRADDTSVKRHEQLGAVCRRLRECAKSLGVPVLLLAQLNRSVAEEKDVPQLHHLRDSGEIEQIADVVMMLHREERSPAGAERIRLFIRKHRNGPLGSVLFAHDAPLFRFTEVGEDIPT